MNDPVTMKLLLVEDEPTQRLLMARALARMGYDVTTADDGEDALEKARTGHYSMVVTDWDMPKMDGVALCRELRQLDLPHYMYIVLLTGNERSSGAVIGLDSGADDYVRKPVEITELRARLGAGRRIVLLEQSLRAAKARIELLSITDALLGIYNRRYLDEQLHRETERSERYGRPLAIVMFDVDHFKRINDSFGHAVGDTVLAHITRVAQSCMRPTDWLARFGGEEFVMVLPETDAGGAFLIAERVRAAIDAQPFAGPAGPLRITASFGVGSLARDTADERLAQEGPRWASAIAGDLLNRADAALYESKAAGRNTTKTR